MIVTLIKQLIFFKGEKNSEPLTNIIDDMSGSDTTLEEVEIRPYSERDQAKVKRIGKDDGSKRRDAEDDDEDDEDMPKITKNKNEDEYDSDDD